MFLKIRSCAPSQHRKNKIQETLYKIFIATSDWQYFNVAAAKESGNNDNETIH